MSTIVSIPSIEREPLLAIAQHSPYPAKRIVADSSQIEYYARSFGDPYARLFWREGSLHLGILPAQAARFRKFLESELCRTLINEGLLIGLNPTSVKHEIFSLMYRLEHTPRITYWHEWSPAMLKAAAMRMLDLLSRLVRQRLVLRNPHPWEMLFDGRQFSYINTGSVVPLDPDTFCRSYEKVAQYFVRPLVLMKEGCEHTAQRLLSDLRDGVLAADIRHLDCTWCEWQSGPEGPSEIGFLEQISNRLSSMRPERTPNRWIDYFATDCDFGPGTSWTRKQEALLSLLKDQEIRSVLDLGANTGHYARLAAAHRREVLATDFDPMLVDAIYVQALSKNLPVSPAVLDFTFPTEPGGVEYRWFKPSTERYAADLVLCFALTHHMVFGKYRLDFEQIARGIRSFSRKWALVEYVERGKIQPSTWRPDADRWYSVENFAEVLRRHFHIVDVLPPATDGRRLLLCGPTRRTL